MDPTRLKQPQSQDNLKESDLEEALAWVEAHRVAIPTAVYQAIVLLIRLRAELAITKQRANKLLSLWRLSLGLIPQSECAGPPPKPKKTDAEQLASLKVRRDKLLAEIRRYEDRLGKGRKSRQKSIAPVPAALLVAPLQEPLYERSKETVFTGRLAEPAEQSSRLAVDRMQNFENPIGLHSVRDERTRYEYGVTTKTLHLSVETVTDPRSGKSVTASTDEIGPPNSQATWTGIANTIIAVVGYAIPINRLALMLKDTCPYFTSSRLCFYLKMSAELFQPIYTYLGEEQLAECDVLQGDDTSARVVEIKKALKNGNELPEAQAGGLIAKLANIFGRSFPKKKGQGHKRSLNVSVVIGKSEPKDKRSYIFFFRTHLGSLGNLLSKILENRSPKNKTLTILSDMSPSNKVTVELYKKFSITHAACAPHARRPFWRLKDTDQRLCYWMLSAFLVLEQIEDRIDELGRTKDRIMRYRQRYSKKVWAAILKRCTAVIRGESCYGNFWPKTAELAVACQYIINHYCELTRYLEDPRLPTNNNLSERVLRWDKIMQDASKFRLTESGRLNIDILRTIVHTCSAAEVDLKDYLLYVFKNQAAIAENPAQFTPYAYALCLDAAQPSSL